MLPLILGAAVGGYLLLKKARRNPMHRGTRGAAARRRMLTRVVRAARANKRSRGGSSAVYRSIIAQSFANLAGVRGRRIGAAVERGIRQGRRNPLLSAQLRKRLMEWRSPDFPAIKALAQARHPATEAYDALRQLMQQYERPDLNAGDIAHLAKTIRMVERETGVRVNPKRRTRISPSAAGSRLALKRWRGNPGAMVRGTKALASRLFNWHGGQSSGVYEVASNWHAGRPVRVEAVNDAWRELASSLSLAEKMNNKYMGHGLGYTKKEVASLRGLTRRLGLIAASHEGFGSNPAVKSGYRLADGSVVSAPQLKRMFMGKIPTPVQRRLLGITLVRDSR